MPLHIVIASPMYGGQCMGEFASCRDALKKKLTDMGHRCSIIAPGNESLIQRARNTIAWHFLSREDTTHLLFIDADIIFRPDDIVRMIEADKDIIIAPVPMKMIDWSKIAAAAKAGVPAEELHLHGGVFNIVPLPGGRTSNDETFPIKMGGAGVMLIKRLVFETIAPLVQSYRNDLPGDSLPPNAEVKNFFPVHVVDSKLLSEDYGFCRLWTRFDGTIWCAPWCQISHMGTYKFTGNYQAGVEK